MYFVMFWYKSALNNEEIHNFSWESFDSNLLIIWFKTLSNISLNRRLKFKLSMLSSIIQCTYLLQSSPGLLGSHTLATFLHYTTY
jgi:hypothetical protein